MHYPAFHSFSPAFARRTQSMPRRTLGSQQATLPLSYTRPTQRPIQRPPGYSLQPGSVALMLLELFGWGLVLECLFLLAFPLLSRTTPANNPLKLAFLGLFPWIPQLDWTAYTPAVTQFLGRYALFDPGQPTGAATLALICLILAFLLTFFTSQIGAHSARERFLPAQYRSIFWVIFLLACLYAATFLFMPAFSTREALVYGEYGRLVTVHHVNPYVAKMSDFPSDLLYPVLNHNPQISFPVGPVWLDICIPVSLAAGDSIANLLLGFRVIGLLAHLGNILLIWLILSKFKPVARVSGTLLYAWNPLILLLGISEMHVEIVVALLLLLGIFFFQRHSPSLGWVFLLLACLVNLLCLILLPLFLYQLGRAARNMHIGLRFLWIPGIMFVSLLVIALAYAPYWQTWGLTGLEGQFQLIFWQHSLINSLDATILYMPVKLPTAVLWLVVPQHWMLVVGIVCALLMLFALWLGNTLPLAVLFGSWFWLVLLILLPTYWPWYALLPITLALASGGRRTIQLALLLGIGALGCYYSWLWPVPWKGQALVTVGAPLLLWGWVVFFTSTSQMTYEREAEQRAPRIPQLRSRPSWAPPRRQLR